MEKVFVYGTLKRGHCNHPLLENSQYLGKATVKGTMLYIGAFPALLGQKNEQDSRVVWGEVYQVNDDTLDDLDMLESEGYMYHRLRTIASMTENCQGTPWQGETSQVVYAYYWGLDTHSYSVIHSGYWA